MMRTPCAAVLLLRLVLLFALLEVSSGFPAVKPKPKSPRGGTSVKQLQPQTTLSGKPIVSLLELPRPSQSSSSKEFKVTAVKMPMTKALSDTTPLESVVRLGGTKTMYLDVGGNRVRIELSNSDFSNGRATKTRPFKR